MEAAGEQEQVEAWFQELSHESGGQQQSAAYRCLYLHWLKQPMQAQEAYLQRAIMHLRAKCYLQVIYHSTCIFGAAVYLDCVGKAG